jgi:regulator of sigma E protease
VVQLNNSVDPTWEDIALTEVASAHRVMDVWVRRNGEMLHLPVTPGYDEKQDVGYAGWGQETEIQISDFVPGIDTAQRVGLQKGDVLVSVNGSPIRSNSRMRELIEQANGAPVRLVVSRKGQQREVTVVPVRKEVEGQQRWMIGVEMQAKFEVVKLPFPQAAAEAVKTSAQNVKWIFRAIEGVVERRVSPKTFLGPVRIAQVSGEAAREGPATFIGLMALISVNLAVVNLMPIPIMDGGVILMLLIEMLLRRDLDLKVKEAVIKVGFVFLMVVLVFVIYNDISKILPPG